MSKTLPLIGQIYLGDVPQIVKIAHVRLAYSGGDVNTGASQATYALFNLPAGTFVKDAFCYTPTAWTTSVTINFGDTNTTNGWLPTATIAPTSQQTNGIAKRTTLNANSEAYRAGVFYSAAMVLSAIVGGANPAVGITDFYIEYIENYLANGF